MSFLSKGLKVVYTLAVCTCTMVAGLSVQAQQRGNNNMLQSVERNKTDNTLMSAGFSPDANWSPAQAQAIFGKYLGVSGSTSMVKQYSTTTKMQVTTDRYNEYFKGIKVAYGSFALMSKGDRVTFISGNYYSIDEATSAVPAMSANAAFSKALAYVGAVKYMWQDANEEARIKAKYHNPDTSFLPKGQLEWVEDYVAGTDDHKLHLAWAFNIYATQPLSRQMVYIDATTGKVLLSNSLLKHTAATGHSLYSGAVPIQTSHIGATYRLFDSTRGNGVHTLNMLHGTSYAAATEYNSATNTWPTSAADSTSIDAQWGGEMVYDYWRTQQGRLSWDNADGELIQYVHYSNNYDNAFWDGTEMTYGDGSGCAGGGFTSLTSLDVTGHEIGHGVCQATANLVYSRESGAMNEGFSDCWGATIENWANPHETDAVAKSTWDIGEEIGCGTPLRSMSDPHAQGQPDTYGGTNWYNVTGCTPGGGNDQCGVHTNSGLLNYWYYLATIGGSGTNDLGNSYVVNPLGWTKSSAILYQTELILSSTATYSVCRTTSISAATTLFGACSPEVQSITNAWYAVGVGAQFNPCVPQIGFINTLQRVSEQASTIACPASKVINIGVKPFGPAITGGNPTINIIVASGATAIAGIDYQLGTSSITWLAGDTTTKYATMTIYDNGAVYDDKSMKLAFTLTASGSTATISPVADTMQLFIDNDDSVPLAGGVSYPVLNQGTLVTSNLTSAFTGSNRRAHEQFMLYASEMRAAGVRKGAPISQIAFNITTKASTAPFIGYTISMGNTALADLGTAFATGLTQVFTGNVTTNLGWDSINFNVANFTWDGVSNVAVEVCYGQNAATFTGNDRMDGIQSGGTVFDNNISNAGTGTGCTLTYNAGNQNTARPLVRFKQTVRPTFIETVATSTHTWNVRAGQEVYFYTGVPDTSLIAGLKNVSNDLGCVTATVTQAGVGFTPAVFSPINRSLKEISITPTINGGTTSYDATMYLTNTELSGVAAGTLFLLKTDEPTDATITSANSIEVTPTLITGTNYVGFKGSFTGFSRFFLVDGPINNCIKPAATITAAGPTTFCVPGSVVLNANTGAGLTYQWQLGGTPIAGATTASYTASAGGNYNVLVYNSATCDSASLPVAVTVNSVSAAPISGATAVCIGQTISLSDATVSGVWSSGNTAIATVGATGIVSGIAAGTVVISYAVTNTCGTATATTTINVSAGITVAPISGTLNVCTGNTTALTDATASGTWSSSITAVATVDAFGVVTGVTAGTAIISYNVTSGSGCVSNSVAVVTVNPVPVAATIAPAGAVVLCPGTTVTFTASAATGLSYQWQAGGGNIAGATDATYTTGTADNYGVVVTNSGGCSATSVIVPVTITSGSVVVPAVSISSSYGTTVCAPAPVETFTANPTNGGSSPVYQWSVNGAAAGAGAILSYTPANGDVISCLLTSNATCVTPDTVSASLTIVVSPLMSPSVSITSVHNDSTCIGDTVQFISVPLYGGTAPTFLWNKNDTNVATGPYFSYQPHDGDRLVLTMTSNYPCLLTSLAVSDTFVMHVFGPTVNDLSVTVSQSSIISGSADTFTAITSGAGSSPSFQWYVDAMAISGATTSVYVTDSLRDGQIVSCEETSGFVCAEPRTVMSGGISVSVTPTGISQYGSEGNPFTLLPNPNAGSFTIRGLLKAGGEKVSIVVTDMLGQEVYSRAVSATGNIMNERVDMVNTIADGVYLVSVTSGERHVVFHMVVGK